MLDIQQLLSKEGIDLSVLIPCDNKCRCEDITPTTSLDDLSNRLPLEIFDDTDYDNRTPEDWLSLGNIHSSMRNRCDFYQSIMSHFVYQIQASRLVIHEGIQSLAKH